MRAQGFSPLCYGARVNFALWSAIIGLLLVVMALSDSVLVLLGDGWRGIHISDDARKGFETIVAAWPSVPA